MEPDEQSKPLLWLGNSKQLFKEFPSEVQREMGYALFLAQLGGRHKTMAKTLAGFGDASVVEVRESDLGGTYRAIYTVRYEDAVYVLHAFQKKSKAGAKTPKADIEIVDRRLKALIAERGRK
jgi:phage-related protein